jgi:hypothetical protein
VWEFQHENFGFASLAQAPAAAAEEPSRDKPLRTPWRGYLNYDGKFHSYL